MARRGKTIDYKEWRSITGLSGAISTDTTTGGGALGFTAPGTILRARGRVMAFFDESQQVGDIITLTWGLGIVSTDAVAAGAASMPDPADEPEYPWLWWGDMDLASNLAAGVNAWGISAQQLEVDTKAMRRIKPGQSLVWIVQSTGAAGTPVTQLEIGQTRVLIGT